MLTLVSRFTPHVSRFLDAGRELCGWSRIVRRSRKGNVGQAPKTQLDSPWTCSLFTDALVDCSEKEVCIAVERCPMIRPHGRFPP